MRIVRLAVLAATVAVSTTAMAETVRPRSIFDVLFGRKAVVETPTSLMPAAPAARSAPFAPVKAATSEPGKRAAPARKAARKAPKDKAEVYASFIDPSPRAAASYTGPFRGGGSQPVCVRLCDGFFFPVNYEGAKGNDRYDEACQASCPGAKTEVYFMQRGADLTTAATARGTRYTALGTAFKYRKERDSACFCKSAEQTWGRVLQQADTLVKHGKSDIVVTDDKAIGPKLPADFEPPAGGREPLHPLDRAEVAKPLASNTLDTQTDLLRALFGESGGRTARFLKIDPDATGSIRQTLH